MDYLSALQQRKYETEQAIKEAQTVLLRAEGALILIAQLIADVEKEVEDESNDDQTHAAG